MPANFASNTKVLFRASLLTQNSMRMFSDVAEVEEAEPERKPWSIDPRVNRFVYNRVVLLKIPAEVTEE